MADDDSEIARHINREIARHIQRYGTLLAEQVLAGGWPKNFTFPEPETAAEREALRLFVAELAQTTSATVKRSKP